MTPNTGQVYIYRPYSFVVGGAIPMTKVAGKQAEGVRNGSYMIYELPPGEYEFRLSKTASWVAGGIGFVATIEEGNRCVYRLTAHVGNMADLGQFVRISMGSHLNQVKEQFAVREMSQATIIEEN